MLGGLSGAGRNADVYDLGNGRVRRYRDGRPQRAVGREAEVMAHARAHGVSEIPGSRLATSTVCAVPRASTGGRRAAGETPVAAWPQ